jgi:hypothetical protein
MRLAGASGSVTRSRDLRQRLQGIAFAIATPVLLVACGGGGATSFAAPAPTPTAPTTQPATPAPAMKLDRQGDVAFPDPPGYLDGQAAGVANNAGALTFRFTLAESIPGAFEVPNGWDSLGWSFCLDTDPAAPKGYPFSPTTSAPCEFIVLLRSSGGPLQGALIDRRTMQDGRDASVTPIDPTIDGTTVTVSVPAGALGDAASFTWVWASTLLGELGTDVFMDVDEIPDSSFANPAQWPPS